MVSGRYSNDVVISFSSFQTPAGDVKNGDKENGEESENLNALLSDITKDIDFQKVDQENEESGVEEMSNGESSKEEAKEGKLDNASEDDDEEDEEEETKKEK